MTEEDFQNVAKGIPIEGFVEDLKASVRFFDDILLEYDTGEKLTGYTWRYQTKDEIDHFDGDL